VNYWIHKRVALNDTWGPGAADSLTTPLGRQPEFSLHARYLRDVQGNPQLSHFSIESPSGYLGDGWQGVHFTPAGTVPVTGITGLPPWNPSQRDTYRRVIDAATSLADSRTARLEGVIPFLRQQGGGVGYNKVRLFYVVNAVQGPVPDLVVIKIASHVAIPGTVQGRQDGNGQGPPH
jgi:hypothetical protein